MIIIYSFGDFHAATRAIRSDDMKPDIKATRENNQSAPPNSSLQPVLP